MSGPDPYIRTEALPDRITDLEATIRDAHAETVTVDTTVGVAGLIVRAKTAEARAVRAEAERDELKGAAMDGLEPPMAPPSWHVIPEGLLLEALRRVEAGEKADLVYAELWANAEHDQIEGAGQEGKPE